MHNIFNLVDTQVVLYIILGLLKKANDDDPKRIKITWACFGFHQYQINMSLHY
jgi:hypothetical protein